MRNAFAAELCGLAAHDERIALISSDIGNNLFNEFRERFPSRFMNCGIAEAAMTGIAAGMALCGLKPVTYTIASFNPGRCVEQIRLDICLHNLPVVIVGVGAGLSYASLGPTHHALEDIAWLRAIPGMTILCPADAVETRCALRAALAHDGPVYLRLGKKNEPAVHAGEPDFEIGRNIPLRGGEDACILAVGTVTPIALDAARLLEERSISCAVTGIHTVKPLDTDSLRSVFARYPVVMVMEEHGPVGGTWSAIAEWAAEQNVGTGRLLRCAAPDRFFFEGGGQNWARKRFGIDAEHAALRIADALRAGAAMILGIDFDNTLVCYDGLFHAAARERGLIPESVPRSKQGVRDYLRAVGREDDFTVLQGYVYGPGIRNASPFPYAVEGIRALLASGAEVCIISHKTRTPILGPRYDLHQAALDWLREQHFFAEGMLTPDRVFLEESKEAKAGRIADMGCTHFVDDLPEFFRLPQFPQDTRRMLFSPQSRNAVSDESWLCFHSWRAICRYCMRHGD